MASYSGDGSLAVAIKEITISRKEYGVCRVEHGTLGNVHVVFHPSNLPILVGWAEDYIVHEISIRETRHLFFDIDYTYMTMTYAEIANIIKKLITAIRDKAGYYVKCIVTESIRPSKISFHIICPNIIFITISEMISFVEEIMDKVEYDVRQFIDMAPYRKNAQLRIVNTKKDDIKLTLSTIGDAPDYIEDYFMSTPSMYNIEFVRSRYPETKVYGSITDIKTTDKYVDRIEDKDIPTSLRQRLTKFGNWRMRRGTNVVEFEGGWDCPHCQRHHDSENASIVLKGKGYVIWCFRSKFGMYYKS